MDNEFKHRHSHKVVSPVEYKNEKYTLIDKNELLTCGNSTDYTKDIPRKNKLTKGGGNYE